MTLFILGILSVTVFFPLVLPWGEKLLIYCTAVWFLLWLIFFLQTERESNPIYDVGIVGDSATLGISILAFAIVVFARSFIHFVMNKANHNQV
ncbi:hypothetical protein QT397_24135 [Microbulbifer sp. MKSA007]|uniref:hypothetical protein n=1 Tax=Microbulbifer sp. EKSA005 TaxID=3243364 RepID=UPI002B30C588|nr:hypothetical protein QT397_24135 [Microbulbifer sp. MKSA007]